MGINLQNAYGEYDEKNFSSKINNNSERLPLISIIVPIYRTSKYIRKCINSILSQSFKNFELILVCDGGEEEFKLCRLYEAENSIIKLINDINRGLGGARNAGIEAASGEYIWFIDSDDWIEKGALCKIAKLVKENTDLIVFEAKHPTEIMSRQQKGIKSYLKNKFSGKNLLDNNIIFNTNVYAWNKIFKKSIIDKNQIRFPEKMQFEDFPFYYHYCTCANDVLFYNEKLYNYLQRRSSNMAFCSKKRYEFVGQHISALKFLYYQLAKNKGFSEFYFTNIFSIILKSGLKFCKRKDKFLFLENARDLLEELNISNLQVIEIEQLKNEKYYELINNIKKERQEKIFNIIPILIRETKNKKIKYYLFNKILIFIKRIKE